jgi:hypothetical protein
MRYHMKRTLVLAGISARSYESFFGSDQRRAALFLVRNEQVPLTSPTGVVVKPESRNAEI